MHSDVLLVSINPYFPQGSSSHHAAEGARAQVPPTHGQQSLQVGVLLLQVVELGVPEAVQDRSDR